MMACLTWGFLRFLIWRLNHKCCHVDHRNPFCMSGYRITLRNIIQSFSRKLRKLSAGWIEEHFIKSKWVKTFVWFSVLTVTAAWNCLSVVFASCCHCSLLMHWRCWRFKSPLHCGKGGWWTCFALWDSRTTETWRQIIKAWLGTARSKWTDPWTNPDRLDAECQRQARKVQKYWKTDCCPVDFGLYFGFLTLTRIQFYSHTMKNT